MKSLVIGAHGQLGRDLCPRLTGQVIQAGRDRADLCNPTLLQQTLETQKPDLVVNCAAYNFVDKAESEPEAAFAVNAFGVRNLASACAAQSIRLVHFSSDYVFGLDFGLKTPWAESDPPVPNSVYSASKLTGEHFVRAADPRNLVIRTCGLYGVWGSGGKGGNFVETMLRLAAQGKPLRVVADQVCTPTYTVDLADTVVNLINRDAAGLFHVTSAGACSWHELASTIFSLSNMPVTVVPITTAEFGAAARRPAFSVLANDKLATVGVRAPRPWQEALAAYLQERTNRK